MMHVRATLDCLGFDLIGKGEIAVRIAKAVFHDDGTVFSRGEPHRFMLKPGDDIDMVLDVINKHLFEHLYCEPISERDMARLKAHAMIEWTPDVIEAHLQRWIQWEIENEAHCRAKGLPALTLSTARMIDFHQRMAPAFLTEDADGDHQNLTH